MDDSLAQVAIDFGGRPWLEWDVSFKHDATGGIPSEMFLLSLSRSAITQNVT